MDRKAAFREWWEPDGRRLCQSLMVATENQTVEQKAWAIFEAGWIARAVIADEPVMESGAETEFYERAESRK